MGFINPLCLKMPLTFSRRAKVSNNRWDFET